MAHAVKLDVFDGPLDLLLQLVSKDRVDVAEVSISTITDEYLRAVSAMGEIDIDSASSFLLLAATLLELKTLRLLPGRGVDDDGLAALLEERDHLIHRLIEYSTFKGAAGAIARRLSENEGHFPRVADIPEELRVVLGDFLAGVGPEDLTKAMLRLATARRAPVVDTSHIAPIRINVAEILDRLVKMVGERKTVSFRELCADARSKLELVVNFLGILELMKRGSVDISQQTPFGDIVLRHRRPLGAST